MRRISRPQLPIFLALLVIFWSCQPQLRKDQITEEAPTEEAMEEAAEEAMEEVEPELPKQLTATDSTYLNSLITELKGIDLFFANGSYKRLQVILNKKEDERASRVNAILENVLINEPDYILEKYMPKNGYLAYVPGAVEVFIDMVYWNVTDGSQLIAIQSRSCGPVCDDMEIYFQRHNNGTYTSVENVIPDLTELSKKLAPEIGTDAQEDPYEFEFKLPIEGKDLEYCLYGVGCLTLTWNDGTFVLKE